VPTTTTLPVTTTSMPGSVLYQVQPGDTMTGIAAELGVSYALLLQLNPLRNPGVLSVGQLLVVPGPTSPTNGDGTATGQASTTVAVTGSTLPAATKTG
jgi:LysM repeat protein